MLIKSTTLYKSNSARQKRTQSSMTSKAAARTALDELSADGAFKRVDAAWRNWISKGEH
jgi:hypothetical protein